MTENQDRCDIAIIGGGQAGIPLAHAAARAGKRVALVERKHLGGSCVNFGCSPTKAVLASARVAQLARRARDYGLKVGNVEVDFPAVLERANKLRLQMRNGLERKFEESDNPELIRGHARLEGREGPAFVIRVDDRRLLADQVVLDTGTRTFVPQIEGLASAPFLHAGNWLDRPELPEHVAIVGAGYIGLEMGQFYRRMGSKVTIIDGATRVVSNEDEDVSEGLQGILSNEGVEFRLKCSVSRVETWPGGELLAVKEAGALREIRVSHLFVATGRKPNTDDLGLETVGVKASKNGILEVDERLATNVAGLWAAGDIRGGPMFTHTAWDDYRVLRSQLLGDGSRTTTKRNVPYAVFTDPELGRVGMTEREARDEGRAFRVSRFEMVRDARAREMGESEGFIKVVVENQTDRILGAAVLCAHGAELVHIYLEVMNADAPYTLIENAIHIHPTIAESMQSAVSSLH